MNKPKKKKRANVTKSQSLKKWASRNGLDPKMFRADRTVGDMLNSDLMQKLAKHFL